MNAMLTFFRSRPWLLVVAAFLLLISAWATIITLSTRVPSNRLTAEQENEVLGRSPSR